MKKKATFFDRDGTLIKDKLYLNDPQQIEYLPGVFDALQKLRDGGYCFFIATNQSGVARKIVSLEQLWNIHSVIKADFSRQGIDILSFHDAPFMTNYNHYLRKPNPGMLLEAARFYSVDLTQSWMVGDRMTDVEAGHRAGMQTVLLGDLETPRNSIYAPPEYHVSHLKEVAEVILNHQKINKL